MSWLSASHNSYIRSFVSHPQLLRPWILSSARDIDGAPRRFTEVVLDEQSPPVARLVRNGQEPRVLEFLTENRFYTIG